MTLHAFLNKLNGVRQTRHGWMACCPAHHDRTPSLSLRIGNDGTTLIYCFAGCSIKQICDALGITPSDLFPDSKRLTPQRSQSPKNLPRIPSFDWRKYSHELMFYSEDRFLHGHAVLTQAKGLDISGWTPEEINIVSNAVCDAIQDIDESERVADLAFNLRAYGLEEEMARYESQSRNA